MKRNEFLKILARHGVTFFRHGGGHDIYINEKTGKKAAVPRHSEVGNKMAKAILKELG